MKKSGLSQALAKRSLMRKDVHDARLTVPAFFHSFQVQNAPSAKKIIPGISPPLPSPAGGIDLEY